MSISSVAPLVLANILNSVGLVLFNKLVTKTYGFRPIFLLTCTHFFSTWLYAHLRAAALVRRRARLPASPLEVWPPGARTWWGKWRWLILLAVLNGAAISAMNASLTLNSVGFYQACKIAITPAVIVLGAALGRPLPGPQTCAALCVMLVGVGLTTVSDLSVNRHGCAAAAVAVMATASLQVVCKKVQADWSGVSKERFMADQYAVAAPMMLLFVVLFEDRAALEDTWDLLVTAAARGSTGSTSVGSTSAVTGSIGGHPNVGEAGAGTARGHWERGGQRAALELVCLVLLTNVLAVGINFTTNELLRRTSALTAQVVGHFKTCILVVGGTLLFRESLSGKTGAGLGLAFLSMIAYSHFDGRDKRQGQTGPGPRVAEVEMGAARARAKARETKKKS
jgi:solute carrier family 35 protein E3